MSLDQLLRNGHSDVFSKTVVLSRLAKSKENTCRGVFLLLIEIELSTGIYHGASQEQLCWCRSRSETYSVEPKRILQKTIGVLHFWSKIKFSEHLFAENL